MTTNASVPNVSLSDGTSIPQLGFGVWQVPDEEAQPAVEKALETGYRLIDTAQSYGNEEGVGRALVASGIPRTEIYLTTKLWNADQGYDSTLRAYDASIARLGVEQVDLYLIHWPVPSHDLYSDTWKALVTLLQDGRVGSIGVSNFHQPHLERVIAETGVTPVLNQIELHPYLQQRDLRAFGAQHDIVTQAWSPLGSGKGLLDDTELQRIATEKGATPAQVVLAWHLAIGNVVIPKSVTPSRIEENFAATGVQLTEADIEAISTLDRAERTGGDPDVAAFGMPEKA